VTRGSELEPLAAQFRRRLPAPAGYITTRPIEARDQTSSNRIGARRHDDWNGLRDSFRSPDRGRSFGDNEIHLRSNQISGESRKRVLFALGETVLDADVLPIDPAVFLQTLAKSLQLSPHHRRTSATRQEKTNAA
jgi:hypothetical protein